MAEPISTTIMAAKAVLTAASDPKLRKGIGWIIAAILSPIIVIVALICGMLQGSSDHNNNALELCFNSAPIGDVPAEYRQHIESMRDSFELIDSAISIENGQMEDGDSLDTTRVKAIFYSLFFAEQSPSKRDHSKYVKCFVAEEERTRTVTVTDDDGNESSYEETYIVKLPISDMGKIYQNIANTMGITATQEHMANATEIYYRIKYGVPAPTYGTEFDDFINSLPISDVPFVGIDGFVAPVADWRIDVSSEFGYRIHPVTGKANGHTGLDIAKAKGTPIYSTLDGTVMLVRYSTTGYGYHVMVDHGGGFVTLYAHASKLLVNVGQEVIAGEKIAEIGTTGRSTGNHLHFEIRINGAKQNPRSYLP